MSCSVRSDTKTYRGRRTNSLAFAKHDCHTCVALKKKCSRQRPRCETCISSRRRCGGFAMDLVWRDQAVPVPKSPAAAATPPGGTASGLDQPGESEVPGQTTFKFVRGRSKKQRRSKLVADGVGQRDSMLSYEAVFALQPGPAQREPSPERPSPETEQVESSDASVDPATPVDEEFPSFVGGVEDMKADASAPLCDVLPDGSWTSEFWLPMASPILQVPFLSCSPPFQTQEPDSDSEALPVPLGEPGEALVEQNFPFPLGVSYQSLAHKYSGILVMYDEEFCIMPLSRDCRTNPFRVPKRRVESSDFLLHAILAVSAQHLAKKNNVTDLKVEMYEHWSVAIQLFRRGLEQGHAGPLLDTLLILVNLETSQSASGMWGVHLNGARQLLEQGQLMEAHGGNSRLRAQIAMLVWWDITIAVLSRSAPRFPHSYLEPRSDPSTSDGWTFFDLNGCPRELVVAMSRLARLAATYEKTKQMEWTIFDRHPVDAVIKDVKNLVNDGDIALDDIENLEEDPDTRLNRYHCIEAWRHAILLYAFRVFTPTQDAYQLRQISHCARVVLDSVRCIPKTDILQKQLLLPMFLAASEMGDGRNRTFARRYCRYWSDTSRFYHFESAGTLLERVWADWDLSDKSVYWWGVTFGHGLADGDGMVSEVLLG